MLPAKLHLVQKVVVPFYVFLPVIVFLAAEQSSDYKILELEAKNVQLRIDLIKLNDKLQQRKKHVFIFHRHFHLNRVYSL